MWVVFRKSDGMVVGASADSELDIDKKQALEEVVSGLVQHGSFEDYDAFQVKERGTLATWGENVASGMVSVQPTQAGGMDLAIQQPAAGSGPSVVTVSTNATDFHPVDNVPLLPGDGESFLRVTLQRVSQGGGGETSLVSRGEDALRAPIGGDGEQLEDDVIWLRPSHGSIREDNDTTLQELRFVRLVNGTATFRFYSEPAKRLAGVQMLSANPNLIVDSLLVEFT
jgi:hypothetical protein